MLPIILLAGGLATRLRPMTKQMPKALVPILKVPFLHHQLTLLKAHGFEHIIMSIGYLGEQIRDYVGDGRQYGLQIQYSEDGERLLGTAGAIKKALALVDEHFFVMNGDSYLPCDYAAVSEAYFAAGLSGLMTVFKNQDQWDKSNVEFSNQKIKKYDKRYTNNNMHYIDYGLSVFHRKVFDEVPPGVACDLTEVYQRLISRAQLTGFEVRQRFYENGSFNGIEDLENYLRTGASNKLTYHKGCENGVYQQVSQRSGQHSKSN